MLQVDAILGEFSKNGGTPKPGSSAKSDGEACATLAAYPLRSVPPRWNSRTRHPKKQLIEVAPRLPEGINEEISDYFAYFISGFFVLWSPMSVVTSKAKPIAR